jgi:hypothetical protein
MSVSSIIKFIVSLMALYSTEAHDINIIFVSKRIQSCQQLKEDLPWVGRGRRFGLHAQSVGKSCPAPPDPVAFPVYGSKQWGEVDNVRLLNGPE